MAGTREYPRVAVSPPRPHVPVWAVVVMTLASVVSVVCWPVAVWGFMHG